VCGWVAVGVDELAPVQSESVDDPGGGPAADLSAVLGGFEGDRAADHLHSRRQISICATISGDMSDRSHSAAGDESASASTVSETCGGSLAGAMARDVVTGRKIVATHRLGSS